MIIWRGNGILIFVAWVLGGFAGAFFCGPFDKPFSLIGGLWGAILLGWIYALTLGKTKTLPYLDQKSGCTMTGREVNSVYFIPVKGLAILSTIAGIVITIAKWSDYPKSGTKIIGAKSAALDLAERWIINGDGTGIGKGNSDEATVLAEAFSKTLAGHWNRDSASSEKLATWCQFAPGSIAFVVKIPNFKNLKLDARDTICDLAWLSARSALKDKNPKPSKLAVAVKGDNIYESIMLGNCSGDLTENITAGLKERDGDIGELRSYFEDSRHVEKSPAPEADN